MNNDTYDFQEIKDPKKRRLAKEHQQLINFCKVDDSVSFEILDLFESLEDKAYINQSLLKNNPPTQYLIRIKEVGIIGIKNDLSPIYGDNHRLEIKFGSDYPMNPPILTMLSDIWHPNIRCVSRLYKGRICANPAIGYNSLINLEHAIIAVKELISYKIYQAEETPPFPEDLEVAKWVREYAEPKSIIIKGHGINHNLVKFEAEGIDKKKLKHMIANGKTKELIDILLDSQKYNNFHNELYLHLANINQVDSNLRLGIIENSEQLFHLRNLNLAILSIIDEIEG